MDWLKCYNTNGSFNPDLLFVQLFGIRPNITCITFNGEDFKCDLCKLSNDVIKSIIPNVEYIFRSTSKYSVIDRMETSNNKEFHVAEGGTYIYIVTGEGVFYIDSDSISCRSKLNSDEVEPKLKDYWEKFPKTEPCPKEAVVKLVGFSGGDYYTIDSKIKATTIDLDENYNDDFKEIHKDIVNFLEDRESGLVLLFGKCGTGKTSYIRHLCNNCPQDYIVIPSSLTTRLSDPDFVTFMIDNSDSVFILEDCEQILMDRSVNLFNGAISNILNMSDGLLSDIMNLKFICTFNADIKTIDEALLRKGRCYAKYEFKELSEDKVEHLNKKYDLGISKIKPMTLAQVYNANKTEYSEAKKKSKIGF